MSENIEVLIVEPGGAMRVQRIVSDLRAKQDIVRGPLEGVRLDGALVYLDEEGKMTGKELNAAATGLARALGWYSGGDVLVGTAIFLATDEQGRDIDVPGKVLDLATEFGTVTRSDRG